MQPYRARDKLSSLGANDHATRNMDRNQSVGNEEEISKRRQTARTKYCRAKVVLGGFTEIIRKRNTSW